MIRRPPRSTRVSASAASVGYKRQVQSAVADADSCFEWELIAMRGLTLIEALLALAAMALIALISSRAIDGILRSQGQANPHQAQRPSLQIGRAHVTRAPDHLRRTPFHSAAHRNGRSSRLGLSPAPA